MKKHVIFPSSFEKNAFLTAVNENVVEVAKNIVKLKYNESNFELHMILVLGADLEFTINFLKIWYSTKCSVDDYFILFGSCGLNNHSTDSDSTYDIEKGFFIETARRYDVGSIIKVCIDDDTKKEDDQKILVTYELQKNKLEDIPESTLKPDNCTKIYSTNHLYLTADIIGFSSKSKDEKNMLVDMETYHFFRMMNVLKSKKFACFRYITDVNGDYCGSNEEYKKVHEIPDQKINFRHSVLPNIIPFLEFIVKLTNDNSPTDPVTEKKIKKKPPKEIKKEINKPRSSKIYNFLI